MAVSKQQEEVLKSVRAKAAVLQALFHMGTSSQADVDAVVNAAIGELQTLLSPAALAGKTVETTRQKFLRLDAERKAKLEQEAKRRLAWRVADLKKAQAETTKTPPHEPKKEPNK